MKNNLKFIIFVLSSAILGVALIAISEFFGFSHLNLIPLGGKSWALWVYPVSLFISLFFLSFPFGIKNKLRVILFGAAIIFLLFFAILNVGLFLNPIPFGI